MWSDLLARIPDAIGLFGVVLLLIAYYLLSVNKMSADSISYQMYNLIGAILILISLFFHWNLSSVVIEIAWIIISLIGIYRIIKERKVPEKVESRT